MSFSIFIAGLDRACRALQLFDLHFGFRVPLKIQIFRHSRAGGNPEAIDSSGIPKSLDSRLRGNDEFLEAPFSRHWSELGDVIADQRSEVLRRAADYG